MAWTGLALGIGEITAAGAASGAGPAPPALAAEFVARLALELSTIACAADAAGAGCLGGGGGICCLSSSALLRAELD